MTENDKPTDPTNAEAALDAAVAALPAKLRGAPRVVLTVTTTPAKARRLDALIPWVDETCLALPGDATRRDVHRLALDAGLDALERRARGARRGEG